MEKHRTMYGSVISKLREHEMCDECGLCKTCDDCSCGKPLKHEVKKQNANKKI